MGEAVNERELKQLGMSYVNVLSTQRISVVSEGVNGRSAITFSLDKRQFSIPHSRTSYDCTFDFGNLANLVLKTAPRSEQLAWPEYAT